MAAFDPLRTFRLVTNAIADGWLAPWMCGLWDTVAGKLAASQHKRITGQKEA
jgi:hypothetical protein